MDLLPQILTEITRKPRQRVVEGIDFEWSRKSWTHNFFRWLETVFGRQVGIRAEFSAHIDEDGKATVFVHSFEAAVAYFETAVRELVSSFELAPFKILIPQTAGGPLTGSPYLFAIAYDSGATTPFGTNPQTVSLTCTGSNLILGMFSGTLNDTSTAPTYNSVASTSASIASTYIGSGRFGQRGYYLIAPATGANTASFGTSAGSIQGFVGSYSGAKQSAQPDAVGVTNTTSANTITTSVTIVTDQSWVSLCEIDSGTGSGPSYTAGTNVNAIRVSDTGLAGCLADGGPSAPGATNYTVNPLGSVPASLLCMIGIAFSPAADAATATYVPRLLTLGVG